MRELWRELFGVALAPRRVTDAVTWWPDAVAWCLRRGGRAELGLLQASPTPPLYYPLPIIPMSKQLQFKLVLLG